jgi:predicted PurR-regulated permease PerM
MAENFYRPFQLFLLVVSLVLVLWLLRPFWAVIILAITFSLILHPLYLKFFDYFKGRKNLASFLVLLLFFLVIFLPGLYFLSVLISQGIQVVDKVSHFLNQKDILSFSSFSVYLQQLLHKYNLDIGILKSIDLKEYIETAIKKISLFVVQEGGGLLSNLFSFITNSFLFFFILFYFVRDLDVLWEKLKRISPLPEAQEEKIKGYLSVVAKKIILGNLLTAFAQGVVGGIGLALVGIPGVFWGSLLGLTSLIPVVGTALVWLPAVGYLLLIGKSGAALFLALWSIILVGSIDNFLRPYLIGRGDSLSPFFLFLALLGGVSSFGFLGLIYGPLIFSFALVMFHLYEEEFQEYLRCRS